MDFAEYEKASNETAVYPDRGTNLPYTVLGLCGEAGEVAEKVKKIVRDKGGKLDGVDRVEIAKELGDVLWYVYAVAFEIGCPLEDVAAMNVEKLQSRKARGRLNGSGDDR